VNDSAKSLRHDLKELQSVCWKLAVRLDEDTARQAGMQAVISELNLRVMFLLMKVIFVVKPSVSHLLMPDTKPVQMSGWDIFVNDHEKIRLEVETFLADFRAKMEALAAEQQEHANAESPSDAEAGAPGDPPGGDRTGPRSAVEDCFGPPRRLPAAAATGDAGKTRH